VVVFRHIADLSEAQIAEILKISRSTVSSTLADAHRRLGDLLDDAPATEATGGRPAPILAPATATVPIPAPIPAPTPKPEEQHDV
jgi:hypothetical protein